EIAGSSVAQIAISVGKPHISVRVMLDRVAITGELNFAVLDLAIEIRPLASERRNGCGIVIDHKRRPGIRRSHKLLQKGGMIGWQQLHVGLLERYPEPGEYDKHHAAKRRTNVCQRWTWTTCAGG